MLHGDTAAKGCYAVHGPLGNRFRVVEKPIQSVDGHLAIDHFENVERVRYGLVIGRVHAPRPSVLGEDTHDPLQVVLHVGRDLGAQLLKILEIGGGENQHFACAIVAEIVVALLVSRSRRPVEEILLLRLGLLRKQGGAGERTFSMP